MRTSAAWPGRAERGVPLLARVPRGTRGAVTTPRVPGDEAYRAARDRAAVTTICRVVAAALGVIVLGDFVYSFWLNPMGHADLQNGVPLAIGVCVAAGVGVAAL